MQICVHTMQYIHLNTLSYGIPLVRLSSSTASGPPSPTGEGKKIYKKSPPEKGELSLFNLS